LEENAENGYPVPDSNKTMINYTKEPSNAHKNTLKEEILQEITENFMEIQLTKMYKMHSRKFMTLKIKNMRRHNQINELRGSLNKHQSEAENTIET
jgi:hypothetical protein